MRIVVTGGFGFIGSNLIHELNNRGHNQIIVVDDLTDGRKVQNLSTAKIEDVISIKAYYSMVGAIRPEAIFHLGALSSTTEMDGNLVMERNYEASKTVFDYARRYRIPFSYASSAAVYGKGNKWREPYREDDIVHPMSPYALSKSLFDQYVLRTIQTSSPPVQGWRYFNVFGSNELHKEQPSPITRFWNQAKATGKITLWEGADRAERDFICVRDVVKIQVDALFDSSVPIGLYNLGTGKTTTFAKIANQIAKKTKATVEVIPMPEHVERQYQWYTQADTTKLRTVIGTKYKFVTVEKYIKNEL